MAALIQSFKIFFLIFTTGITIYYFIKNYKIGFKYYMYFVIISALLGFARPIYAEVIIIPFLIPLSVFFFHKYFNKNEISYIPFFVLAYGVLITFITKESTFLGIDVYFVYGFVLLIFSSYLFKGAHSTLSAYISLWLYAIAKSIWLFAHVGKDMFLSADLSVSGGRLLEFETGLSNTADVVRIDPNYFGFIAGIGFLLSILFIIYRNQLYKYFSFKFIKTKWFLIAVSLIAVLELWISIRGLSRGVLFALIVSILVFFLLNKNFKIFAISSAFLIITYFVFQDMFELFLLRFSEDNTGGGRYEMWKSIWELLINENRVLLGVGLNYPWWQTWVAGSLYASTHNSWMTLLLDVGLIGLILLIIFIFKSVIINYKDNTTMSKIRLVMLAYFVVTCFSIEPLASNVGWILFAVSVAYDNNKNLVVSKKWKSIKGL